MVKCTFLAVFLLLTNNVFATFIIRGRAESLIPVDDHEIKLTSMTVTITPKGDGESWQFMARYVLRNPSGSKTVMVGIPVPPHADRAGGDFDILQGFEARVNNQVTTVQVRTNVPNPVRPDWPSVRVISWPVKMGILANAVVEASYSFVSDIFGENDVMNFSLKTASLWKDRISDAEIVVRGEYFDSFYLVHAKPDGYRLREHAISWSLRDFEPDLNVSLSYRYKFQAWVLACSAAVSKQDPDEIIRCLEAGERIGRATNMMPGWEEYGLKFKDKYLKVMEDSCNAALSGQYVTPYKITTEYLKGNRPRVAELSRQYVKDIQAGRVSFKFDIKNSNFYDWFAHIVRSFLQDPKLAKKFYKFRLRSIQDQFGAGVLGEREVATLRAQLNHVNRSIKSIDDEIALVEQLGAPGGAKALLESVRRGSVDREIIMKLYSLGRPAYPLLVEALKSPVYQGKDERYTIIAFLGGMGDYLAVSAVLEQELASNDSMTREFAARGLANIGQKAVPPLERALKDPAENVRLEAANSLLRLKNRAGILVLIIDLRISNRKYAILAA